ncbi:phosphotransferase [Salirhabdus sp. Marseille-P4669]|uniref:phosphotransferase n=1 Tax=Salirhabdus sp. Marseille-P4669 TaxID=2042310 RepID=UPI000C7C1D88|nr:phosphotransferase [Salirhabdus sp. Marseille-P4669]
MEMRRKIGEGSNAEVLEWGDNQVLKLAKPIIDNTDLEKEFHNHNIVWELGLPVPRPYEMIEYENRPGIVYERIYGKTLRERFFENLTPAIDLEPTTIDWNDARLSARLLGKVHNTVFHKKFPSTQREFLKKQIRSVDYLLEEEQIAVLELLDHLPKKSNICHGDANPNNIIFRNSGEPILIDWMNGTNGNPEADVAEFILMIRFSVLPPHTPKEAMNLFDTYRENIIQDFMKEYTQITGTTYDEIDSWIAPIAARKLSSDGIGEEEKQVLVKEIRRRLS